MTPFAILALLALAPAELRPNIVLIYCDDLGYADIGPFGAKTARTPNLDKLAKRGRSFTNFHVAQPVCSASRAALLTGCYPNRLGIHGALGPKARHGIHAEEETIAELLKGGGYQTAAIGKWHLGHREPFLPTRHGFESYFGLPYSNDMWPHHPETKKGTYPNLPLFRNEKVINEDVTPMDQSHLTDLYTKESVRFIETSAQTGKPFFLYLAHSMPHVPLFAGPKFAGKSPAGTLGDVIEEIDDSVGQVMAALEKSAALKTTWIIFTSDNGPWLSYGDHAGSSGPFREGKGTCFEGGVRVPCIMSWPGRLPANSRADTNFMTIDLLPTIAAQLNLVRKGPAIDGRDVWDFITAKPGVQNPHEGYAFYYENNQLQAVASNDGRYKLQLPHIYRTLSGRPGGKGGIPAKYDQKTIVLPQLYDLIADPSETKDISATEPEILQKLLRFAQKCRTDMGDSLTKSVGNGLRSAGILPDGQ